jgi:hypothetical protein
MSAPAAICAEVASFDLAGSNQDWMKVIFCFTFGFTSLAPAKKALIWSLVSSAGKVETALTTFDFVSLPASCPIT